jgi:hypothetical protein
MSLSAALSNITHALQAKDITALSKRRKLNYAARCLSSDKLASSELSELLLRSSKEPEIVPDLTLKLSLWQRLEWGSQVARRHQQVNLWSGSPEQLEFEFDI